MNTSFQDLPSSTRAALKQSKHFAEHLYSGRDEPAGPAFMFTKPKNDAAQVMLIEPALAQKLAAGATQYREQHPAAYYTLGSLAKAQFEQTPGDTAAIQHALKSGTVKSLSDLPGSELILVIEHQTPTLTTRCYYQYLGDDKFADTPMVMKQESSNQAEGLMGIRFFRN